MRLRTSASAAAGPTAPATPGLPCAAGRRSSGRFARGSRARPPVPPGSRRETARPSRSAAAAPAAAPGRRPAACRRSTRAPSRRGAGGGSRARSGAPRRGRAAAGAAPASRGRADRVGLARDEDLLLALGQRDHGHARQVVGLHRRERRRQLALAAVDHDQVRRRRERLVVVLGRGAVLQPREAARDDLRERGEVVLPVERAHAELAVVRLLRHRVLEDDHRADHRLALDVRDVVALDPQRQALEVQRLAQLLERLHPPQPLALGLDDLRLEREPRVLGRQLLQPPLLAAHRRAHLDVRAAPVGEELLERARVARVRRDDELRRHARRRAVVLDRERLQQRRRVLAVDVLEVEAVAVDQPPVAQREDLHRGPVALDGQPDHVDRADRAPVGRLPLDQVPHREQAVAVAGRLLEALALGRLLHLPLELALDRPRLAGEELDHALDDLAVVLLRDVAHARRQAALDVVVEARNPAVAAGLRALAGPVREDAVEHVERLAHLLRVRVRAEVDDPAPVPLAREHHPRVVVLDGDRDVRERLVVAQADVERRAVALDQVLLQVQRLDLGVRDDHLDVGDPLGQALDRRARVRRGLEVRAHARPQRLGLADVEHLAALVAEEVDARLRREPFQLLFDMCGHGRARVASDPVKKAVLAAVVAAAALGGVILAVVLSGGGGDDTSSGTSPTTGAHGTTVSTGTVPATTSDSTTRRETTTAGGTTSAAPAPPPPPAPRGPRAKTFLLGTVDDSLAQQSPQFAQSQVDVSRDAGFDAAVISAMWRRGERRPPASLVSVLRTLSSRDAQGRHAAGRGRLARARPRHPADPGRPRGLRRLGGRARDGAAAGAVRDRRQRAEPEHLLEAAVRGRRQRPRGPRVRRPARAQLRRDQGRAAERAGARRRALAARRRPARRHPPHALADRVHPRPRRRLPRERPPQAADGRVRVPPVHGGLGGLAERRTPAEHDDHARRLSEAGRAARAGLPRHRPAGRAAAGLLHGVRRPDRRAGREAPLLLEPRVAGAHRQRLVRDAGRLLPARARSSPTASRPSAGSSSSTPSTRRTSAAGSRASTSPTARPSRACRPSSAPSPTCATASLDAALARLSRRGRPVRRLHLLPRRSRLAPAADRRARRGQGRLRRGGRGLRRPHVLAARLLDDRRAARDRLLPLEDHRALRGPRRARRGAERDAARRLAEHAVLVPGDDEGLRVHEGAQAAAGDAEGLAVPRRLPVREAALLVLAVAGGAAARDGRAHARRARVLDDRTTTRPTRSGSTTRSS